MPITQHINTAKENFKKAIDHLHHEFSQIQAGRANPAMVENIMIEAYGAMAPIKNNAQISIPEPQSLSIQPYDKSLLSAIEKSIRDSDLNLNPINDGTGVVRINIPPLTEERRRDLVKIVHAKAEEAKVSIRNARHDAQHHIRAEEGISEDVVRDAENDLQEEVKKANKEIEDTGKGKEAEVMKV